MKTREMGVQYGDGGEQANPNNHNSWEFGAHPIVGTACAYDASSDLHAYPLKYVNVTVSGCECVALEDSGCQILSSSATQSYPDTVTLTYLTGNVRTFTSVSFVHTVPTIG